MSIELLIARNVLKSLRFVAGEKRVLMTRRLTIEFEIANVCEGDFLLPYKLFSRKAKSVAAG